MQHRTAYRISVLVFVLSLSAPGSAAQITLAQCQALKDRIDHYTQLRRAGGSAARMDRWKRARRAKEEEFDRHRCRRYRRDLK